MYASSLILLKTSPREYCLGLLKSFDWHGTIVVDYSIIAEFDPINGNNYVERYLGCSLYRSDSIIYYGTVSSICLQDFVDYILDFSSVVSSSSIFLKIFTTKVSRINEKLLQDLKDEKQRYIDDAKRLSLQYFCLSLKVTEGSSFDRVYAEESLKESSLRRAGTLDSFLESVKASRLYLGSTQFKQVKF